MEAALAKIRPHKNSGLPHQKTPATLLAALESTLDDQKTERSPVAYFAALLTTLEATIQKGDISLEDGDVLPAELYLLALVAPFVPVSVIKTHLTIILSLTSPLFPSLESHAPALRSQITLYHTLFSSLDRSHLEVQGLRQTFASILQLCIDKRPKVRRKAAEVVESVLSNPPAPLQQHPYAERVAAWIDSVLEHVNGDVFSKSKSSNDPTDTAIHLLAFLRPVLLLLPSSTLPQITTSVLSLPRLGNPYLSQSAYATLSDVFLAAAADPANPISSHISDVLDAVLASPPLQTDNILSPAWVKVVGDALLAYSKVDESSSDKELFRVWKIVWGYLESTHSQTRAAAVGSLQTLTQCFSDSLLTSASTSASSTVPKIVSHATKSLDSLAFARAFPEMLAVFSSLFTAVAPRAPSLLVPAIQKLGTLRTQKNFEFKEDADKALTTAMQVLGPQALLEILPLNLEPADREAGKEPRAYLLPMLAHPHSSSAKHFVTYFVPLSERLFDLQQTAEAEGRQSEAKVWAVIVAQIWAGLPCYNWATTELSATLDQGFSQLLSQLLYGQPDLRPAVLKALRIVVDSNVTIAKSSESEPGSRCITQQQAQANVNFLKSQSESWLAVLFNVFSSVSRNVRNTVGDVINAWASISGEKETSQAFHKVIQLFQQSFANPQPASREPGANEGSVTAMMQDILLILLPYLSAADTQSLFTSLLTKEVLSSSDNGVQKRGYKLLAKITETERLQVDAEDVLKQLDGFTQALAAAAKKDRYSLLSQLIQKLPSSSMHVIPSIIPEAVLGTKEPSEKGRHAAFELIVMMGTKMSEGGVVKRSLIDGMDEDEDSPMDAKASIGEYMTMVAGGLAGATPHMISATITALSRLLFEFKDQITETMQTELLSTVIVFVTSNNREIVKSALGFIKLSIHTLPLELLRPHLPQLVPALLNWSHDHANHFKVKVRHIFERMMRRLTFEEIYQCVGDAEEARERGKVLLNIKKRKERAKKKKAAREDAEGDEEVEQRPTGKQAAGDAFEDVLYGSESELEDSDDDDQPSASAPKAKESHKKKGGSGGARLRMDDDDPMDLLEGAAARISNAKGSARRKPGQDASHFKTDTDTGKIRFDNSSDDEADDTAARTNVAGTAYKEGIVGVDGFTRGPNGRVKFNKDTKKRRREELEAGGDGDVDMEDASGPKAKTQNAAKKKKQNSFGQEFKAKRAGGDVKKNGVEPYAYMPLNQAAKQKKGSAQKLGIVGKR